jgi:hypothetical protein
VNALEIPNAARRDDNEVVVASGHQETTHDRRTVDDLRLERPQSAFALALQGNSDQHRNGTPAASVSAMTNAAMRKTSSSPSASRRANATAVRRDRRWMTPPRRRQAGPAGRELTCRSAVKACCAVLPATLAALSPLRASCLSRFTCQYPEAVDGVRDQEPPSRAGALEQGLPDDGMARACRASASDTAG